MHSFDFVVRRIDQFLEVTLPMGPTPLKTFALTTHHGSATCVNAVIDKQVESRGKSKSNCVFAALVIVAAFTSEFIANLHVESVVYMRMLTSRRSCTVMFGIELA